MFTPYWISTLNECAIGISECPSGASELITELDKIRNDQVRFLVSTLTDQEDQVLGYREQRNICSQFDIQFRKFPIRDQSIPMLFEFSEFIELLYEKTKSTSKILIFDRSGVGGCAIIALGLMLKHGIPMDKCLTDAELARGRQIPYSIAQRNFLSQYSLSAIISK